MADDGRRPPRRGWLTRLRRQVTGEPQDREALVDELREAAERGLLDLDALEMLEGVLEVGDLQVRDIMVPRSQMIVIERDERLEKLLPVVVESGHSRFPVIGEDRGDFDIREVVRPAVFVPESKRLNILLKEFRKNRHHMAMVADEYGGVAGLVTIEDVIEQIVGDIADEYDVEEDQAIRREAPHEFTVRALTRIGEFNDYFGTVFSDDEFGTIGGLVAHAFGRVPRRGDTVSIHRFQFRVLRSDRRRIEVLRVTAPLDVISDEGAGG